MKGKEKAFLLILIAFTIVVVIFAVNKNKSIEKEQEQQPQQQTQKQEENKVEQEFVQELGDGLSINTSDKLKKTKKFEGLEIKDLQLTKKDGLSQILGTVINTTKEIIPEQILRLKIIDKSGEEIISIDAYVKALEAGESSQFNTSASFDYVNAYDFVVSKKEI